MVTVVTDSCASVPQALVELLNIRVVPYYVHTAQGAQRDGVGPEAEAFYEWLRTTPNWPRTANPSAGEYLETYRDIVTQGTDGIVEVSMTGRGSGGFQSATLAMRLAKQELPDLEMEVVDTRTVALAHGWSVIQAARAALDGATVVEVAQVARRVAESAFVGFTNETLEYLQRGGRIGKVAGTVGTMLSIMPIIGMRDGMPSSLALSRTRETAYRRIVSLAGKRIAEGSQVRAALMHVAARDEVEKFRSLIEARYTVVEWIVAQLSPALGVHSGPGTAGIALIPAE